MDKQKKSLLQQPGFQTVLTSVICVLLGLLIGFIALLIINPAGAGKAITTIILNFFTRPTYQAAMKTFGNTLVKTAPLLMCALSVQFCYKVGLFNIGAAGQYTAGACIAIYAALAWKMPWLVCLLLSMLAGGFLAAITGILKAYRNVNEVISGIMLNWITLYFVNMVLSNDGVKDSASPYTLDITANAKQALIPSLGLTSVFANNRYVTIAIPLSILIAILIWIVEKKTKFGYELAATGYNKDAAKYAGMKENRNIIVTLIIGGALAGLGAGFFFLSGYEKWSTTQTSVPGMGFNGIAATFLGGLNPIGTVFASYFIQHITDGGALIDKNLYPSQVCDLITAIIIYFCGFVLFFRSFLNRRSSRNDTNSNAVSEKKGSASE